MYSLFTEPIIFYTQLNLSSLIQLIFYSTPLNLSRLSKIAINILQRYKHLNRYRHNQLRNPHMGEREVKKAIKDSNNKGPGPDGLTYEFYKTFESQMLEILSELYNNMYIRGRMEDGMRESYIRLIHKKGDTGELKNWRPISLSNTDYKIMSKVFTNRLNKVLPQLINEDQVCGITGRSIQRHLYLL